MASAWCKPKLLAGKAKAGTQNPPTPPPTSAAAAGEAEAVGFRTPPPPAAWPAGEREAKGSTFDAADVLPPQLQVGGHLTGFL